MATPNKPESHESQGPPPTPDEVLKYATEQLHAIPAEPAIVGQIIHTLEAALHPAQPVEDPPKDLKDAISRIEAKLGKLKLKHKPDLNKIVEDMTAAGPPPQPAVNAPFEPKVA